MNERKLEGRIVYVPALESRLRTQIARGSGIVGTPQDDGQVLIDFEGAIYGQQMDYTERVLHAHDRHTWPSGLDPAKPAAGYPTIARMLVNRGELVYVGQVEPRREVTDEDVRSELSARYGRELMLAEIRPMPEFEITRRQMQRPRVVIERQAWVDEWCEAPSGANHGRGNTNHPERDDLLEIEGASGIVVQLYTGEDGTPVVQIDTPPDTDLHDEIRVHLNDSTADRWAP